MSTVKIYHGKALQAALDEILQPVEVLYQAADQPEADTLAALQELAQLTPHLSFTVQPQPGALADRLLVHSLRGRKLVFVGAPVGTELAALVAAVVIAGRGDSGLDAATRLALAALTALVHLEVFTTPT